VKCTTSANGDCLSLVVRMSLWQQSRAMPVFRIPVSHEPRFGGPGPHRHPSDEMQFIREGALGLSIDSAHVRK
jgi:hypothetical protein